MTNYTTDEIQEEFESVLATSTWWKRAIGSQFVSFLSLFIAQVIKRITTVTSRSLQESFLSSASKRSSILAGAEDRGYVGLKISPSTGTATVTNTSDERYTLGANSTLLSTAQLDYIIVEAIDLKAGESAEVTVKQLWLESVETTVTVQQDWLSVLLTKDVTASTYQLDVYVDDEQWEKTYKFRNADDSSQVYMEYYKATEQLGVRFGNNETGKSPEVDSVIRLDAWCTEGVTTLLDGQALTFSDDNEDANDYLTVVTSSSIVGGAAGATTEEIRAGALYSETYDEQLAWDGDYKQFIKTQVGGLIWLSVWGEAEQEELDGAKNLANINTIFISAYSSSKDDDQLEEEILALFEDREAFNESYEYVVKTDLPYTVTITGITLSTGDPESTQTQLANELEDAYGADASDKSSRVTINELYAFIEDLTSDLDIVEFQITVADLPSSVPVNSYSYLDIDNSTITFSYEDID